MDHPGGTIDSINHHDRPDLHPTPPRNSSRAHSRANSETASVQGADDMALDSKCTSQTQAQTPPSIETDTAILPPATDRDNRGSPSAPTVPESDSKDVTPAPQSFHYPPGSSYSPLPKAIRTRSSSVPRDNGHNDKSSIGSGPHQRNTPFVIRGMDPLPNPFRPGHIERRPKVVSVVPGSPSADMLSQSHGLSREVGSFPFMNDWKQSNIMEGEDQVRGGDKLPSSINDSLDNLRGAHDQQLYLRHIQMQQPPAVPRPPSRQSRAQRTPSVGSTFPLSEQQQHGLPSMTPAYLQDAMLISDSQRYQHAMQQFPQQQLGMLGPNHQYSGQAQYQQAWPMGFASRPGSSDRATGPPQMGNHHVFGDPNTMSNAHGSPEVSRPNSSTNPSLGHTFRSENADQGAGRQASTAHNFQRPSRPTVTIPIQNPQISQDHPLAALLNPGQIPVVHQLSDNPDEMQTAVFQSVLRFIQCVNLMAETVRRQESTALIHQTEINIVHQAAWAIKFERHRVRIFQLPGVTIKALVQEQLSPLITDWANRKRLFARQGKQGISYLTLAQYTTRANTYLQISCRLALTVLGPHSMRGGFVRIAPPVVLTPQMAFQSQLRQQRADKLVSSNQKAGIPHRHVEHTHSPVADLCGVAEPSKPTMRPSDRLRSPEDDEDDEDEPMGSLVNPLILPHAPMSERQWRALQEQENSIQSQQVTMSQNCASLFDAAVRRRNEMITLFHQATAGFNLEPTVAKPGSNTPTLTREDLREGPGARSTQQKRGRSPRDVYATAKPSGSAAKRVRANSGGIYNVYNNQPADKLQVEEATVPQTWSEQRLRKRNPTHYTEVKEEPTSPTMVRSSRKAPIPSAASDASSVLSSPPNTSDLEPAEPTPNGEKGKGKGRSRGRLVDLMSSDLDDSEDNFEESHVDSDPESDFEDVEVIKKNNGGRKKVVQTRRVKRTALGKEVGRL